MGACYYFITIGQGSGWYLGPNPVYDAFAGHDPPHTSRRDLIGDIHAALAPHKIRLGVYLPYEPPWEDVNVSARMQYRETGQLPQVSQDLLGGRFPLGQTLKNGSRGPWVPEQYGLDDSVGAVFGHGKPYGFGTDRLVEFQTVSERILSLPVETHRIYICDVSYRETFVVALERDDCRMEYALWRQSLWLVV